MERVVYAVLLLLHVPTRECRALQGTAATVRRTLSLPLSPPSATAITTISADTMTLRRAMSSSADVDSDEDGEQHMMVQHNVVEGKIKAAGGSVGNSTTAATRTKTEGGKGGGSRFDSLLASVGLEGKLKHATDLPAKRQVSLYGIFCNRELKLSNIKAIGFDMDYTLAQYQQPAFDRLAFDGAKEKLVTKLGYPPEVLDFEYDHERWTRGLIIDTERGNFLKIDRHKYVRVAYHGLTKISSGTRKLLVCGLVVVVVF